MDISENLRREKVMLFYEFGIMVASGVPLLQVLKKVFSDASEQRLKEAIKAITESIIKGESLSAPLSGYSDIFSPSEIKMIETGEETGMLSENLLKISEMGEKGLKILPFPKSALITEEQDFFQKLSLLLKTGTPIIEVLATLSKEVQEAKLKETVKQIVEDIEQGSTLYDAFSKHSDIFPGFAIKMIKSGEAGGVLDIATSRIADIFEKRIEMGMTEIKITKQEEIKEDFAEAYATVEETNVIEKVNNIIVEAVRLNATHIHLEPQAENKCRVLYRIDSLLHEREIIAKAISIISRIKILASLDLAEHRIPMHNRFRLNVKNKDIGFSVLTMPTVFGEKVAIKILSPGSILKLSQLGFEPEVLKIYREKIKSRYGIILVTGPCKSGISTTLYSTLRSLVQPEISIIAIGDSVEFVIPGIQPVQIRPQVGYMLDNDTLYDNIFFFF